MIVIHVTRGQRAMSIHVKADIQSERQLSKEFGSAALASHKRVHARLGRAMASGQRGAS
jgi:hypothetical protein